MKNIEELMKKIQEIEEKGELSDEALAAAVGGATMRISAFTICRVERWMRFVAPCAKVSPIIRQVCFT